MHHKFDKLDLFFKRPYDDSTESKHVAIRIFCCNKLLCLTEIYTLYELDKHIGMTNVQLSSGTAQSGQ